MDNKKAFAILIPVIILSKQITIAPWWSFIIPVLLFGVLIGYKNWPVSSFVTGFLSGFAVWFGATLYYDTVFDGSALSKVGLLLSMPKVVVMLISGVMGGLLAGLALFTGKILLVSDYATLEKKIW